MTQDIIMLLIGFAVGSGFGALVVSFVLHIIKTSPSLQGMQGAAGKDGRSCKLCEDGIAVDGFLIKKGGWVYELVPVKTAIEFEETPQNPIDTVDDVLALKKIIDDLDKDIEITK